MGDINDLVDLFGEQRALSGAQDFYRNQFGEGSMMDQLAQSDPRTARTLLPGIVQQLQQQNAINTAYPQPSQQSTTVPQQVFPPGIGGDQQPGALVPQTLPTQDYQPNPALMQPQVIPPTPPTALQRMMGVYANLPAGLQTAAANQQLMGGDSGTGGGVSDVAAAIANYKMAPPTGQQLKTPMGIAIQNQVLQINPDYDANQYKERTKTAQDFSPGGNVGQKFTAVQTAVNHLASLMDASDKIGGINSPIAGQTINGAMNYFKQSNPNMVNYNGLSRMAGDEVAKSVAGTGGSTEGDRANQEGYLSANQTPIARKAAAQTAVQAMFGKLEPLVDQYNKAYNTNKSAVDFLSPETQSSLAKLGMMPDNAQPPSSGSALQQLAAPQSSRITPAMAQAELARRAKAGGH